MSGVLERIEAFVEKENVAVWGIAPSSKLESQPVGHRPSDILPTARTVFCLGIPIPRGLLRAAMHLEPMFWRASSIYYRDLDKMMMRLAAIVEETGESAVPVNACFPYQVKGWGDFHGFISLVYTAEAVGIGKVGKNGLLFNDRYGPRLFLGGFVTSADLPATCSSTTEQEGCPEDCFVCQEVCPVSAIANSGKVDRVACLRHSMKSPIFSDLVRRLKPSADDLEILNQVTGVDDHSWYECTKCLSQCPYL